MIELTGTQKRWLRARGQTLKPNVHLTAKGLTDEARDHVLRALDRDELLKVRLAPSPDRKGDASRLAEATGAALAGLVGRVALLYRPHPDGPRLELPSPDATDG